MLTNKFISAKPSGISLIVASLAVLIVLLLSGMFSFSAAGFSGQQNSTTLAPQTENTLIYNGVRSFSSALTRTTASPSTSQNSLHVAPDSLSDNLPKSTSSSGKEQAPSALSSAVTTASSAVTGWIGLSALDSTNAQFGGDTGLTVTPPDQALCTDGNYVMEGINAALTVYTSSGIELVPPVSLYALFGTPAQNFPIGDVRCFHDPATNRWFISQLDLEAIGTTPFNGVLDGFSYVQIAVSTSSNPLGNYYVYTLPTIDNGSQKTPVHPGCPCFGDQPLIGMDKYGVYISTNEFPIFTAGFNGAQVYALNKHALESGKASKFVQIWAGPDLIPYGGLAYSLQPALNSPGQSYAKNTEYFLSALQFTDTYDHRIAVWALQGTNTIPSGGSGLKLVFHVIQSEKYGMPSNGIFFAAQPKGTRPLASLLKSCTPPLNIPGCGPANYILEKLNADDDRMQMVTYADGYLWAGLETLVSTSAGLHNGIAWFIVSPIDLKGAVDGVIVNQGYIATTAGSVLYPSVVANNNGEGAVAFTFVSPNDHIFPSSAFATISLAGTGPIQIVAFGAGPLDDFSGYPAFGGNGIARWGDYSWAVAAPNGHIWIASEYIPNTARTLLTNYGTFIANVPT